MKNNTGKALYYLLMLSIGVCLIIGGFINIKKHNSLLIIGGGFAIGVAMTLFGLQGLLNLTKSR